MIIVAHNLAAMNAQRQFGITDRKDKKTTERLSSGYRINRAADDAAGLVISEKMRAQIRGLNQGTKNAQDGVSWVQIGDGALDEVHAMLHRMTELSVQSLNGIYTDEDRAAMEAEFDQLQSQIDNITQNTQFNTMEIFSRHEPTFYQVEGNISWPHDAMHDVYSPENTLVISYREKQDDPPVSVTLTVPEGRYTTQELADEIDDAIADSALAVKPKLHFEYTDKGTFNANLEGGVSIESVSGGLSSLLNKTYQGGSAGALIGTTIFPTDDSRLQIKTGKNDHLSFVIEDFSGNRTTKDLTLAQGWYNREQLIGLLNDELADTDVTAKKYGTGIMLSGEDCIISQFKGNMFQIDSGSPKYTSIFYDNVFHGNVSLTRGTFTGGAVLPTSSYQNGRDVEHGSYQIVSGVNDTLAFKANGAENATTVTIPEGRYTSGEMALKLNALFADHGLSLTAATQNEGNFAKLKIESRIDGASSDVGIVRNSSTAFDTLFVTRKYNVYTQQATVTNEGTPDRLPVDTGAKAFTNGTYTNLPLTVEATKNDTFALRIGSASYNITLAAGTYSSATAVKNAVNTALSNADLGVYSGKITASLDSSNRLTLTADKSAQIVNLSATSVSGNTGYQDLFTTSYRLDTKVLDQTSNRLDRVFPDPTSISESEKIIRVESLDGTLSRNLELPVGNAVTHQQIIDKIDATEGVSRFSDIQYSESRTSGYDHNFSGNQRGTESFTAVTYNKHGTTTYSGVEGQAGTNYTSNTPASIQMKVKDSFTLGTGTDELKLRLNGNEVTLKFDHGTYTRASFATALQQKIDAAFGQNFGGATVRVSGTDVVLTSRLVDAYGTEQPGEDTSIYCTTDNSGFLREMQTTRGPAEVLSATNALIPTSGINIQAGDTFVFTLNDVQQTVTLKALSNGSGASFANMLTQCMREQNIPVTASAVSYSGKYRLKLTTADTGRSVSIGYSSASGGSVSPKLYGDLTAAGSTTAGNVPVKESVTIEDGKNAFRYSVNGTGKTVYLTPGTYSRAGLLTELNEKLEGVTASYTGNYLKLTSDYKGSGSSVYLPYDSGSDSAMRSIWGQNETRIPALRAYFDDTDHLWLESKEDGRRFKISSAGTTLVEQTRTPVVQTPPSPTTGYYSTRHATMDGGNLNISASDPLIIDEWNNTLQFNYFKDSSYSTITVNVASGTYTSYEQLQTELQSKLDQAVGNGELTATVNSSGVLIRAQEAGYSRRIGIPGYSTPRTSPPTFGDFYDKVMNPTTERTETMGYSSTVGSNVASSDQLPYTLGRRNVKDKPVTLKEDINDTLTLDFAYTDAGGHAQNKTFSMKLDEGTYQGDALARMIQGKLNEQLTAQGLSANLIEVKIGGTNANVAGVENDKVLTFKLSNSLPLPSAGQYTIDGIGGNAAFSVFYQTTGELVPAYVEGVKDIDQGITIEEGKNTLSFTTDDQTYTVEIPAGKYTGQEILHALNDLLAEQNAPVKAERTEDGVLRLSHKKMGNHPITDLSGTARGSLFFNEYSGENEERSIRLQFSSVLDDNKELERPPMSTAFLGINTVTISKIKYAGKALNRVQGALDRVSEVRSYFGASQNAIEHVINRNNNTSENMQAAESRIRDTDMVSAMMEHTKLEILKQAGQAMLAQANQDNSLALQLLQ